MIRTCTPNDAALIADLQRRHREELGFLPHMAINEALDERRVAVTTENDADAGYILWRPRLKQIPRVRPIIQAAVCMDARRRHHGLALLDALAREAQAAGQDVLQCWCAADIAAVGFWLEAGFTEVLRQDPSCNVRGRELILFRRSIVAGDLAEVPLPTHVGRSCTPLRVSRQFRWRW